MSEAPIPTTSDEAAAPSSAAELLFPEQAAGEAEAATSAAASEGEALGEASPSTRDASAPEAQPASEAPEPLDATKYELALPETLTSDKELEGAARLALADAGVPYDKAQPLVDLFSTALSKAASAAESAWQAEQSAWLSEIDSVPEFQGPTREKSLESISKLFDAYGTPEAKEALNRGGIGNNPALARMMLKVAQALDEGSPTTAARPAPNGRDGRSLNNRSAGQVLFPDQV